MLNLERLLKPSKHPGVPKALWTKKLTPHRRKELARLKRSQPDNLALQKKGVPCAS